jgi:hypothetical protein
MAAQSASMLVEADVADVRIVTRTVRPLSFGEVQPGRPVTVDPRMSPEAGMLEIAAAAGTEFRVAMAMPDRMESEDTGATLPIHEGAVTECTVGAGSDDCTDVTGDAVWESGVFASAALSGNAVQLRVGGTVRPPDVQPPGRYRGTMVASLAFTAN